MVADVLPARGVQVQFALTHTLIQSLLIMITMMMMMMMMTIIMMKMMIIMMIMIMMIMIKTIMMMIVMIRIIMMVLYLCPKEGHGSREENVKKLNNFLADSVIHFVIG